MEKDHLNDKVLDKEKALSAIKTSYLNSYKILTLQDYPKNPSILKLQFPKELMIRNCNINKAEG